MYFERKRGEGKCSSAKMFQRGCNKIEALVDPCRCVVRNWRAQRVERLKAARRYPGQIPRRRGILRGVVPLHHIFGIA